MTTPARSRETDGGRVYEWGGVEVPSVTNVLGELSKHLEAWVAKLVGQRAVLYLTGAAKPLVEQPTTEDLRKWFSAAAREERDAAADRGTAIHGLIEQGVPGDEWPKEYRDHGLNYEAFRRLYRPRYVEQEATVYSLGHGYAGTLDAIVDVGNGLRILDVKTGKSVYPEVALQLAAYRYADFVGEKDGTERPLLGVTGGLVLHLRAEGFALIPVECGLEEFDVFLSVLSAWRWRHGRGKKAVGKAIPPPSRLEAAGGAVA